MERFEEEFSDAFGNRTSPSEFMEGLFPSASVGMRVAVDVKEEDDRYEVVADVPGLSKEDITIQLNPDRVLTLSGERKSEEEKDEDGYYRLERKFGKFMRSFQLPKDAEDDRIRAKCEAGVLTVTIPKIAKPEEEPGPKVIDVE